MKKAIIFFICLISLATPVMARPHFFLIGSPGSGKGTFTQFLTSNGEYVHISLGDMLRAEITKKTYIGRQIEAKIKAGEMIDHKIVFSLFEQKFYNALKENKKIIVDGMLHSKEHIKFFDGILKKYGLKDDFNYVYLSIPREVAESRIKSRLICKRCSYVTNYSFVKNSICPKCGSKTAKRMDDEEVTTRKRLDRFYNNILPLIGYYSRRNGFKKYDSSKDYKSRIDEYKKAYLRDGH